MDKLRAVFAREGFSSTSTIRKPELEKFLNSLTLKEKNQPFDVDVFGEIWEQCSNGTTLATIEQVCETITEAQNIVQNKLLEIADEVKYLRDELNQENKSNTFKID